MKLYRSWMYERLNGPYQNERFVEGVTDFVKTAIQHDDGRFDGRLRCSCTKCKNGKFVTIHDLGYHLVSRGFTKDYYVWTYHGEPWGQNQRVEVGGPSNVFQQQHNYDDMLVDAFPPVYYEETEAVNEHQYDEGPPPESKHYFDMLNASQTPLYDGCKLTMLDVASELLTLKCEYNLPHRAVEMTWSDWISSFQRLFAS